MSVQATRAQKVLGTSDLCQAVLSFLPFEDQDRCKRASKTFKKNAGTLQRRILDKLAPRVTSWLRTEGAFVHSPNDGVREIFQNNHVIFQNGHVELFRPTHTLLGLLSTRDQARCKAVCKAFRQNAETFEIRNIYRQLSPRAIAWLELGLLGRPPTSEQVGKVFGNTHLCQAVLTFLPFGDQDPCKSVSKAFRQNVGTLQLRFLEKLAPKVTSWMRSDRAPEVTCGGRGAQQVFGHRAYLTRAILNFLPIEDQNSCKAVCQDFRQIADSLQFGNIFAQLSAPAIRWVRQKTSERAPARAQVEKVFGNIPLCQSILAFLSSKDQDLCKPVSRVFRQNVEHLQFGNIFEAHRSDRSRQERVQGAPIRPTHTENNSLYVTALLVGMFVLIVLPFIFSHDQKNN